MQDLFGALFLISFILLVIGLIRPSIVIRWGKNRTRKRVALIFGIASLAFFILIGITAEPPPKIGPEQQIQEEAPAKEQQEEKEEAEKEPAFPISEPEPEPEPSETVVRLIEENSTTVALVYGIDPIELEDKGKQALLSGDLDKLDEFATLMEKHAIETPRGTRALLFKEERILPADRQLGRNWPVYYEKVKILDGPHKDKIGWVVKSHIKFY